MSVLSRFWYVAAALLFVPFVGFNADEVMFLSALYPIGRVPAMLMPYLGATKSLAYFFLVRWLPPTPLVVRLPMVLLSCVTLWLFFRLVASVADRRVAIAASVLLATDVTFVLCTSLDWAPAAVQICGSVLLATLVIRAVERPSAACLTAIGLLAGYLVWNKAVFLFSLAGALAAAGMVFRDGIRRVSWRALAILTLTFAVGCLPLILYNVNSQMGTWRARETLQDYSIGFKLGAAVKTLDGSIFNGYMFAEPKASTLPRHDLMAVALLAALLVLPWTDAKRRRLLAFAWIAMLATFVLMAPFRNAGAGPQHIVLLYPLPHLIVAASFAPSAEAAGWLRKLGAGALAATVLASLYLTVLYRQQMSADGLSVYWTDAVYGLERELRDERVAGVAAADWGIEEPVRVLSRGRIEVVTDDRMTAALLEAGKFRVVTHAAACRLYPQRFAAVEERARADGMELVRVAEVSDGRGRAVFDVFAATPRAQGQFAGSGATVSAAVSLASSSSSSRTLIGLAM